jgi:general secretion pathway protein G
MITALQVSGLRPRSVRVSRSESGFTLIELMIAFAVVGLLAAIAGSNYLAYIEKVRVASAVASIRAIQVELDDYVRSEKPLPATLAEIGKDHMRDPWGHPFSYLPFQSSASGGGGSGGSSDGSSSGGSSGSSDGSSSGGSSGSSGGDSSESSGGDSDPDSGGGSYLGAARKDHFLVPLNSDYDLYSVGKDGDSRPPLSAPVSADDVIRASDGAYIGLAANY